jgi:hypothetical protein
VTAGPNAAGGGDAAADAAPAVTSDPPPGSISFVITSYEAPERAATNLATVRSAMRDGDEIIVLTGRAPTRMTVEPWYRIVTIPDVSEFTLRARIPVVCNKQWVVLLEEHALMTPRSLEAIRQLIRSRSATQLIVVLGKNLTSTSPWAWAVFLHTWTLVWAPIEQPPPFAPVTSAVVRRDQIGGDGPLEEGAWELQVVPRIFRGGKVEYSNEIYVDHVKPMTFGSAVLISFHNARAGAGLQRKLGFSLNVTLYEGWHCFARRPQELGQALAPRRHELPAGIVARLRVVGFAHMIGIIAGVLFGGGRSAMKL